MKRTILIRRKPLELTTLDNVLALRMAPGKSPPDRLIRRGPRVPSPEVGRFRREGWFFVRPTPDLLLAARGRPRRPGIEAVREVHLTAKARILLTGERLTVKLKDFATEDVVASQLHADGLAKIFAYPLPGVFEVRTLRAEAPLDAAARLAGSVQYHYVEPVFEELIGQRWRPGPSNTKYVEQWQWNNSGSGGGTAGADTRMEAAWDITRGGTVKERRPTRVAVVDYGLEPENPEIEPAILHGAYYKYVHNCPPELVPYVKGDYFPPDGHGTACATLAIGRSKGVHGCGAAPEADFIPVGCLQTDIADQGPLALALLYAAFPAAQEKGRSPSDGTDIISCSLGPRAEWHLTSVLDDAITEVVTKGRGGLGVPIFWAVSNEKVPVELDEVVTHELVISVASTTWDDIDAAAAFGPRLDFVAPGIGVTTSVPGGKFEPVSGTSFATPIAAGICALVVAKNPSLTAAELRAILRDTCDDVGPVAYDGSGRNDIYGSGRLNASKAILA